MQDAYIVDVTEAGFEAPKACMTFGVFLRTDFKQEVASKSVMVKMASGQKIMFPTMFIAGKDIDAVGKFAHGVVDKVVADYKKYGQPMQWEGGGQ